MLNKIFTTSFGCKLGSELVNRHAEMFIVIQIKLFSLKRSGERNIKIGRVRFFYGSL